MNLTRLMALGTLARYGPQHGHQIRRLADLTNVGEWGGVSVGALYRELRAMEGEGLVETIRTEKVGRRPARTVYEITGEGQMELQSLREQAIKPTGFGADPLGVALTFAAEGMDLDELRDTLRARRNRMEITAVELAAELDRLTARGYLGTFQAAIMRRGVMHHEAEVRWHDELDAVLAAAPVARAALLPNGLTGQLPNEVGQPCAGDESTIPTSSALKADQTREP
jgi:DNA-binding PadR family transcriptional regulator